MSPISIRSSAPSRRAGPSLVLISWAVLAIPAICAAQATAVSTVEIKTFAFTPKEITITPGTKIIWTNRDETPHTVTGKDKSFASKGLDTGDTFEHTFVSEGDFSYLCTLHPIMVGVVHVRKK